MKKLIFILLITLSSTITYSQNLIYNGDFELFDSCPTSISTPGDPQLERCSGWKIPTMATSDYYNACASWPASVPINTMGIRTPYSGNAYCGLLIEHCLYSQCDGWWIEYIQSKLIQPLKANYEYLFNGKIAFSNKLNEYAYTSFGAYFSEFTIFKNDNKPLNVNPQIQNANSLFLTDTLNWTEITGKFIAQGDEKYITLGFFIDTTNVDTLRFTDIVIDPNNFASYYYIDDFSLIETGNVFTFPNVFTPNDDGENDIWKPFILKEEDVIEIFNRWGNKIYTVNFKNKGWDGKNTSGKDCSDGVYFYISTSNQKGTIQLIR